MCLLIHFLSFYHLLILHRFSGALEPLPALLGDGGIHNRSPVHHRVVKWRKTTTHTHVHSYLHRISVQPIKLPCLWTEGGSQSTWWKTHARTGRACTCTLHTERPWPLPSGIVSIYSFGCIVCTCRLCLHYYWSGKIRTAYYVIDYWATIRKSIEQTNKFLKSFIWFGKTITFSFARKKQHLDSLFSAASLKHLFAQDSNHKIAWLIKEKLDLAEVKLFCLNARTC